MRTSLLIALVAAACTLSGCTALSKVQVNSLNQSAETELAAARSRISDPAVEGYINGLGRMVHESARRIAGADRPDFKPDAGLDIYDRFSVYTVHDVAPNAFTQGDNFACVNSALLAAAESPEELVIVLGHEFGHMEHGHIVNKFTSLNRTQVAAAVAGGVAGATAPRGATEADRQQRMGDVARAVMGCWQAHSPPDEHESDAFGVRVMADLGLDLQYADDFFVRMLSLYGEGGGSHPKTSERIDRIRSQVAELQAGGYRPTRTLDRAPFEAMRERVRQLTRDGVASNTIVFHTQERSQAAATSAIQPMGCGPLDADPDAIIRSFRQTMGLR